MAKQQSRPQRWAAAVNKGKEVIDQLRDAITELSDLRDEYEEWQGNLPENLENSALGEKLSAVVDLNIPEVDEIADFLDECESMDLPQGFGKD